MRASIASTMFSSKTPPFSTSAGQSGEFSKAHAGTDQVDVEVQVFEGGSVEPPLFRGWSSGLDYTLPARLVLRDTAESAPASAPLWRTMWRSEPGRIATLAAVLVALTTLLVLLDGLARVRLGRSLAIRQIDAGSCNDCELEIHALNNVFYDLERFGFRFVASPRHADVLLVTGPVTANMHEGLERTWRATPNPKWVVAVGDCAFDGGLFAGSYACLGGVGEVVPVDLHIRGCPPTPTALLQGLLALLQQQ